MQQCKDTIKRKKVENSPEQMTISITEVIKQFKIKTDWKAIKYRKRSGVIVTSILHILLILPFVGVSSLAGFVVKSYSKLYLGEKDVYYRFKNNHIINWRKLLMLMTHRFIALVSQSEVKYQDIKENVKNVKAIIFDDTVTPKTGKVIEGVGMVHDHTQNINILGFKILVCGYWTGSSFIPLDFSIHRENRQGKLEKLTLQETKKKAKKTEKLTGIKELKTRRTELKKRIKQIEKQLEKKELKTLVQELTNKQVAFEKLEIRIKQKEKEYQIVCYQVISIGNEILEIKSNFCGLKSEENKDQYKKTRKRNTAGYKRKKELDINKIDMSIKMLKRAVQNGFVPDYVLTDSWFFCQKMLVATQESGVHYISMARINNAKYLDLISGKFCAPKELLARYERTKKQYSRKHKADYVELQVEYQGNRVKIFLVKLNRGQWRLLVSSDLKISFNRIIEVYKTRWIIEVFFKECKQHLLLGKSQSRDFDGQIADISLSFMRYILLSYYQKSHYGITIGGLFRDLAQETTKITLLIEIKEFITELVEVVAELAGTDSFSVYENMLRSEKSQELLKKLGWETEYLAA